MDSFEILVLFLCIERIYLFNSKKKLDPAEWIWNNKKILNSNLLTFFKLRLTSCIDKTQNEWISIYLDLLPEKFSTLFATCSIEESNQLPRTIKELFYKQIEDFNVMSNKVIFL